MDGFYIHFTLLPDSMHRMAGMKTLILAACLLAPFPLIAKAGDARAPSALLEITLRDGSLIKARPGNGRAFSLAAGKGVFSPDWSLVREMQIDPENNGGAILFTNGDKLTFRWAANSIPVKSAIC